MGDLIRILWEGCCRSLLIAFVLKELDPDRVQTKGVVRQHAS